MNRPLFAVCLPLLLAGQVSCSKSAPPAQKPATEAPPARASDTLATSAGELRITPIHHAAVLFEIGGKAIYVDPTKDGNYKGLPKADFIFVTHVHPDHLDPAAIDALKTTSTVVVGPKTVADKQSGVTVLGNGETKTFGAFSAQGFAMYNVKRGPEPGAFFHPKGDGDGFVLTFGNKRVYLSGDTECTDEMRALEKIDVAFVCMNLPYTMPPDEAATCVKAFRPQVVYPYHYKGKPPTDVGTFTSLVAGEPGIEVRVRDWYY